MTDGRILLGVTTLIAFGVFLNGWRFSRMTTNPFSGRKFLRRRIEGAELSVAQLRLFGRLQMIVAPIFLCLFAGICLGLFGPSNIQPIRF